MIEFISQLADQVLLFSINYFIHSTVLLGLVLLAIHGRLLSYDRLGEWVMKSALLLGCFTALAQTNGWLVKTQSGWSVLSWQWTVAEPSTDHPKITTIKQPQSMEQSSVPESPAPQVLPLVIESSQPVVTSEVVRPVKETGLGALAWLSLWLTGLTLLGLRQTRCQRQWQILMAQRIQVSDASIVAIYNRLLSRSGLPADIQLSQSTVISSPVAHCREVICPADFLQYCPPECIEAALAHELAHIKRRDGWWLPFAQWFQVLLFFQPLNRLLMQHIHQATEQKADDMAAEWTENPRALAMTLLDVAKHNRTQPQLQMVPAMSSKKSKLLQRVENILQPNPQRTSRLWTFGLISTVLLILVTGPGVVAKSIGVYQASGSSSHHISIDDGVTDIKLSSSNDERSLKLKAKLTGDMVFTDDESRITAFPANSNFDLTHQADGIKRRILIESAPGTHAENAGYTYWYEGKKQAFDASAQAWLAEVMPMVWRETGLQAEARVERIRDSRGDTGVLDEVALIESDFVRKTYLSHLFELAQLAEDDLEYAMTLAVDIGSDFELSQLLSKLVETQNLGSEDLWLSYFASTQSIDSDFEMAKTMLNVLPQLPETEDINQAYFNAAESIGSDFEMAKVLMAYLERKGQEATNVQHLFAVAADIGSDFELAKVLLAANQHIDQTNSSDALFDAYLALASHIGSDFEMKKVYADVLKHDLSERHLVSMIESAADHIGSDFELANLLLSISKQQPINATIKARIKEASRAIGSEYERNRVLAALS